MNYVIAKVKRDAEYKKVYSGESIYNLPTEIDMTVEYSPSTVLDEGEWFRINEFSKQEYCPELLKQEFRSTDYTRLHNTNAELIEYICSYESGVFCFQRLFKHSILGKCISLGDNVELKQDKNIVINDLPDAIYYKENDVLLFRKLQTIMPIFKKIEVLYKEATREETKDFLNSDFINLTNGYNADKVGRMNRKRIAIAIDTLHGFDEQQRKEVFAYTNTYYPQMEYKDNAFSIGNEEDMRFLLWGIEQRYYTTPVTKEQRIANSVMSLESV